jgi:hypothetical protein
MMKNRILLISLLAISLLTSCHKKEVLLPQVPISGETDIQNHSEVWVFYNEKGEDTKAIVNKNNLITSTNWILNIDRRLKLYDVIPVFQMIHAKRAKKTMHSVEGMTDYISYSNTKDKNISVFPISDKKYLMLSWEEILQLNQTKLCENELIFYTNRVKVNGQMYSGISWEREIDKFKKNTCIQLLFESNMTYQQYVKYRLELHELLPEGVLVQKTEYIIK